MKENVTDNTNFIQKIIESNIPESIKRKNNVFVNCV